MSSARFAGVIAAVLATGTFAGSAGAGEVDRGRLADLLRQDCGSCHGLTLNGGLGRPLTPGALSGWDRASLASVILDGVPGTPMPPWRPLLTRDEVDAIVDMLKTGDLP